MNEAFYKVQPNENGHVDRPTFQYLNFCKILYPIQEAAATPTSNCPTWRKRWSSMTREWAFRRLHLLRESRNVELEIWEDTGYNERFWIIEQGTKQDGSPDELEQVLEVVSIVDLPEDSPEDRECAICKQGFNHGEEPCSGGGEVARQIPCPGQHVFGVDCIVRAWKTTIEESEIPHCPICRHQFNISTEPPRLFRTRLDIMVALYHFGLLDGQRFGPGNPQRNPNALSFFEYALYFTSIVAAFPMFVAVNHSMSIWNSVNGKLPYAQMAVVVVVVAILQSIWLLGLSLSPLFISFLVMSHTLAHRMKIPRAHGG